MEYEFWYSETLTYKAGFVTEHGESLEEVQKMLDDIFIHNKKPLKSLPGFWQKLKESDIEYDSDSLEELEF